MDKGKYVVTFTNPDGSLGGFDGYGDFDESTTEEEAIAEVKEFITLALNLRESPLIIESLNISVEFPPDPLDRAKK